MRSGGDANVIAEALARNRDPTRSRHVGAARTQPDATDELHCGLAVGGAEGVGVQDGRDDIQAEVDGLGTLHMRRSGIHSHNLVHRGLIGGGAGQHDELIRPRGI